MSVTVKQKSPGWLNSLIGKTKAVCNQEIAVGFPMGKQKAYPDGTSVVEVAASHVYGVGVPQRDFMAYAKGEINEVTGPILRELAANNAKGGTAVTQLANSAGEAGAQAIKNAILSGPWVPNSPETIAKKRSSKPLIDTSHMINAVTFTVRERTK